MLCLILGKEDVVMIFIRFVYPHYGNGSETVKANASDPNDEYASIKSPSSSRG